ncbi:hypothetical protein Bca101_049988 [Brassica carinata]
MLRNCFLLSIVIKSEGKWSTSTSFTRLFSLDHTDGILPVSVEGPYGPASTDFLRHDSLVMVSGSSGITPIISIIRDLINGHDPNKIHAKFLK